MSREDSNKLRESRKQAHIQLKEEAKQHKADLKKQQGAGRKGAHQRP
jgi:hypothetical protein